MKIYSKEFTCYTEEMAVYIKEIDKCFPFRAAMNEMLLTPLSFRREPVPKAFGRLGVRLGESPSQSISGWG
jgi:hypothetical protein